jgi:sugar/nucleoside kinase (ribokinase family)
MNAGGTAPRIIGIGAIFIDDIVLPDGRTHMGQPGGGVLHALMGAALWDERPGIVAPIGQGLSDAVRALLEDHFDTRGLVELPIPQIRAWQIFEHDGTRRELFRVRETEPFTRGAQPEYLPQVYRDGQGYYLLQGFEGIRTWSQTLSGLVLWEPLQQVMLPENREPMRAALRECRIDVISPNLVEAQAVYGALPPDELLTAFFDDGAQIVALRMGEQGSLLGRRTTGERQHIPACPVQQVVDQTGAGNTYCGGLLCGLVNGRSLAQAGAVASVSASFCIEGVGALRANEVSRLERDRRLGLILRNVRS